MISLSLTMIVKNEQDVLARCLNSVKNAFDEIIIVDTGSTDKTKEIAKEFTNKIYDFSWCDNFAMARNFALSKATSDFIMWLDADDVMNKENLNKLIALKEKLTKDVDIILLKYALKFVNNKPTFSFFRERIFNREKGFKFQDPVHEYVALTGKLLYEDIIIEHHKVKVTNPKRNIKIYQKLIKQKVPFSPRQLYYYARELYYNDKFTKSITYFKKFLSKTNTFLENKIEACLIMSKCYQIKKQFEKALNTLFLSFVYDYPRAEICCEIAYIFQEQKQFTLSNYWFKMALNILPNMQSGGFVLNDCYDYIPYLEMCVNYFHLKNYQQAFYYNNLAKQLRPNDKIVLNNEKILINLLTNN